MSKTNKRKKISIVVPCYNEQENVRLMSEAIESRFNEDETLKKYDYDILFIYNDSAGCIQRRDVPQSIRSGCGEIGFINPERRFAERSRPNPH